MKELGNIKQTSQIYLTLTFHMVLPWWVSGKESGSNAGDMVLIPGLGRCLAGGNGNPLQYSCLANSMDRGAWWATVCGVAKELNMNE